MQRQRHSGAIFNRAIALPAKIARAADGWFWQQAEIVRMSQIDVLRGKRRDACMGSDACMGQAADC